MNATERARLAEAEYRQFDAALISAAAALQRVADELARYRTAKARALRLAARIPDVRLSVETELLLLDIFDGAIAELEALQRRLRPPRKRRGSNSANISPARTTTKDEVKKNKRMKPSEPVHVGVRLGVTREGGDIWLVMERNSDRIRLPLTPSEARLVATSLMTAACQADPQGHVDMLNDMRRENALATMPPPGGIGH